MNRYPSLPADSPSLERKRRLGSQIRWPMQLRVARWQQDRFVPLITGVGRVSGGELFQTFSGNCT